MEIELGQLGHAHSGGVEQFQDGAITLAQVGFLVRGLDKANGVLDGKMHRQLLFQAWRGHEFGGVLFQHTFPDEELKEGPQGSQFAGNGSLLLMRSVQSG